MQYFFWNHIKYIYIKLRATGPPWAASTRASWRFGKLGSNYPPELTNARTLRETRRWNCWGKRLFCATGRWFQLTLQSLNSFPLLPGRFSSCSCSSPGGVQGHRCQRRAGLAQKMLCRAWKILFSSVHLCLLRLWESLSLSTCLWHV